MASLSRSSIDTSAAMDSTMKMYRKHKHWVIGIALAFGLAYLYRKQLSSTWQCIKSQGTEHFEMLAPYPNNVSGPVLTDSTTTESQDTLVAYQPGVSAESWSNTFSPLDQAEAQQSLSWVQAQQNIPQPELLPMNVAPEYAALLSNQNFLQAGSITNGGQNSRPVFRNDSGSNQDFFRQQFIPTVDANAMAGTQMPVGEPVVRMHPQL